MNTPSFLLYKSNQYFKKLDQKIIERCLQNSHPFVFATNPGKDNYFFLISASYLHFQRPRKSLSILIRKEDQSIYLCEGEQLTPCSSLKDALKKARQREEELAKKKYIFAKDTVFTYEKIKSRF